jgi:hypothetical protein
MSVAHQPPAAIIAELVGMAAEQAARNFTPLLEKWKRRTPARYAALPLHGVTNFRPQLKRLSTLVDDYKP